MESFIAKVIENLKHTPTTIAGLGIIFAALANFTRCLSDGDPETIADAGHLIVEIGVGLTIMGLLPARKTPPKDGV